MYEDLLEIAENRAYLTAVKQEQNGPNLELLKRLQAYAELKDFEEQLREQHRLTFHAVFHEPIGYYLLKNFLQADYAVDNAVFISDVELFKNIRDASTRRKVARMLYERFVAPDSERRRNRWQMGESVFDRRHRSNRLSLQQMEDEAAAAAAGEEDRLPPRRPSRPSINYETRRKSTRSTSMTDTATQHQKTAATTTSQVSSHSQQQVQTGPVHGQTTQAPRASVHSGSDGVVDASSVVPELRQDTGELSLNTWGTNSIGVYGKTVRDLREMIERGEERATMFDAVAQAVYDDLIMDVFPRFLKTVYYRNFIRAMQLTLQPVSIKDFTFLRTLGRGAFGAVNACIKQDSGKLYAMKVINKRRVFAADSGVETIMAERNFLARMNSDFVVCLKYAVMDRDNLYLVLDLMVGGDLKFHLNKDELFDEERARFYAAEILLGLEHIHSQNIIYRDVKLENVLLDDRGHCRVSDLGLAVETRSGFTRGYAGTPGYVAPEVVLGQQYDRAADFFSYGVMIYRFLCGKKPFARGSGNLDKNVVDIEPTFPEEYFSPDARSLLEGLLRKNPKKRLGCNGIEEVKNHPWFASIDWGLLEAGYLDPPFVPNADEVNADSLRHIGRPTVDERFKRVKLTEEFEARLSEFPYASSKAIQQEIVEVMEKANESAHMSNNKSSIEAEPELDTRRTSSCMPCCIM